ncbi:MAG: alpha/beta fold hydrolase [Gammaproteobacteria bacterium]|nr:alpha/beta fold hydrolase [Gammaproteobacteria bacterium]MBK8991403.1 alpha/beta fold hydrolase [Gammaproteobacteria bacterium]MBK9467104.1 alpha/beta fold hydrolase [Gammaproteobacteria bacterium]MBP6479610.1 alpha/beta fold hydrolase [Pseudomonadales bacterium]MBP7908561.1 alpha/beta fold hydrolase [Pseudomonadales bacterium]
MSTVRRWTSIDADSDRRLAVSVGAGRGIPFVWGHALQCSMRADEASGVFDWSGLAPTARVIRYDARAHGESCSELDPRGCAWESLARDMWRVADDCGAERPVLGGASMGCATAVWAAMQRPRRVAGLVLVIPPTAWELRPRQVRSYLMMARLVRIAGRLPFRAANAILGERVAGSPLQAIAREVVRGLATRDPRNVEAAFKGAALSDLPAIEDCARLRMPTLILAWRDDSAHPVSIATRLAEAMPKARLVVAENDIDVRRWPEDVRNFMASTGRK